MEEVIMTGETMNTTSPGINEEAEAWASKGEE